MQVVEIILEDDLLEELQIVAEIMGLDLEMLVVMACQKYVQWINQYGFPHITGLQLRAEEPGEEEEQAGGGEPCLS